MPILPFLPAIAAGANIATNLWNTGQQKKANQASRDFSNEQYSKQKKDSLAFWNMQNKYNDPSNQMKRYQEAGLNPNLIYGSGGSPGQASPIKTPDVQSGQFRAPELKGNAMSDYLDTQIKLGQIDNLKADNTVKLEEALLKEAQTANINATEKRSTFDLGFETDLRSVSADYRREQLRQTSTAADKLLNDDERAAALTGASLKESAERVLNVRANTAKTTTERRKAEQAIKLLATDTKIRKLDLKLRKSHINPNDPPYLRALGIFLDQMGLYDKDFKYPTSKRRSMGDMRKGAQKSTSQNWLQKLLNQ